jgi:hypothetical protein
MNDLWLNIFKEVEPALVGCLTLDRVLVSRAGDKLVARFFASRLLDDREFSMLSKALRAAFPQAKASLRVSYPALREDVTQNVERYAKFICGLVTREMPSAMPFLQWEEASWKMRGGLLIAEVDRMGVDYLVSQGVDRRVEALMKELFGVELRVMLEPAATRRSGCRRSRSGGTRSRLAWRSWRARPAPRTKAAPAARR